MFLARHVSEVVRRALFDQADGDRRQGSRQRDRRHGDTRTRATTLSWLWSSCSDRSGSARCPSPGGATGDATVGCRVAHQHPRRAVLGAELRAELASADRVDLLCAFIRGTASRVLADAARRRCTTVGCRCGSSPRRTWAPPNAEPLDELVRTLRRRGADPLRRAVHAAAREGVAVPPGQRVRHRRTSAARTCRSRRCSTAWSGTSASPRSPHPTPGPQVRGHLRHLLEQTPSSSRTTRIATPNARRALAAAGRTPAALVTSRGLEVRPRPHQERILEALDAERTVHDRHRNLVVAATGTGKTVDRRARLPAAASAGLRRAQPAVRRAPRGDPRAGAAHLPRGAGRRRLRRAATSAGSARAVAARLRLRPVAGRRRRRIGPTTSTSSSSTSSTTPRPRPTARCSSTSSPASCSA